MNSASVGDPQHTVLVDEPRTIDISSIEGELTSLWKQATSVEGDDDQPAVIRACSLNLVVWTDSDRHSAAIDRILGDMTVAHPSRIFLVTAERGATAPSLEAWVSARCSIPLPGEKQVCCEQINLIATGPDVSKVSSVITSLLVPDVPVVLFWKDDLQGEEASQSLIHVSDHLLIDSSDSPAPLVCFRQWRKIIEEERSRVTFRDLTWSRLVSWRAMIADQFEQPRRRERLRSLRSVSISYSNSAASSGLSQALLLLAWLAHSLDFVKEAPLSQNSDGIYTASFRFGKGLVSTRVFRADQREELETKVESITMEFDAKETLSLEAMTEKVCMRVTHLIESKTVSEELISAGNGHAEELFAHELDILDTDDLYRSSVKILLAISEEGKR